MNREKAKLLLPIITAFAEGKEIEFKDKYAQHWEPVDSPSWLDLCEYRIKPAPRMVYGRNGEPTFPRPVLPPPPPTPRHMIKRQTCTCRRCCGCCPRMENGSEW